jgi:hypothetical protein
MAEKWFVDIKYMEGDVTVKSLEYSSELAAEKAERGVLRKLGDDYYTCIRSAISTPNKGESK